MDPLEIVVKIIENYEFYYEVNFSNVLQPTALTTENFLIRCFKDLTTILRATRLQKAFLQYTYYPPTSCNVYADLFYQYE